MEQGVLTVTGLTPPISRAEDAAPGGAATARDRFSEASTVVWLCAAGESRRLGHFYIGVEHLFLGIASRQPLLLERTLRRWGLDPEESARLVLAAIGTGPPPNWDRLRVTPRMRAVLLMADGLRREANREFIEPIHLLVALLTEGNSIPARLLTSHGVSLAAAIAALAGFSKQGVATPLLDQLGCDLVESAAEGGFDPLVGRDRELELLMEVLCRRSKNNPVLVGEAGVGKTAIIEGLAQRVAAGKVPPALRDSRIVQITGSRLLAGGASRGEEQVRQLIQEAKCSPGVILFVDEMHTLAGGSGVDAAALLKPPLARGELRCIGATTLAEYRRFIEGEPALERRFQPILVDEPGKVLTLQILQGLRERYERHHRVSISDDALRAAVTLSNQYLRDRQQPDKAIDLMDQAASRVAIRACGASLVGPPLDGEGGDACALPHVVAAADVAGVLSSLLGMEVLIGGGSDPERLRHLEEFLGERVLGQQEAIGSVAQVVRMTKRELDLRPFRPDGVILLVGPSGVGKTLLARSLCEFLHGENEDALVRLDMSEYSEPHSLARLVGPPPGYIGYEEEGQLTGRVRTRPDCLLLLDDIERAHPSVRALFLQVFDEGRLTDSRGRSIHFDHSTIILTASTGSASEGPAGFRKEDREQAHQRILGSISDELSSDFVSRVDRVVLMAPLDRETVVAIADKMLRQVAGRLAEEGKKLEIGEGVAEIVAAYHYNPRQGARHLARAVEDLIIEPLSTLSYRPGWAQAPGVVLSADGALISVSVLESAQSR